MDRKQISVFFLRLGALIIIVALFWWYFFYDQVFSQLGMIRGNQLPPWGNAVKCIFSSTGECGVVSSLASMVSGWTYTPVVFWIGAVLVGLGVLIRTVPINAALTISSTASGDPANHGSKKIDVAKWNALLQYDVEIKQAADRLAIHGPAYVDKLAEGYLALTDKTYLPQIVQAITAEAEADQARAQTQTGQNFSANAKTLYIAPSGKLVLLSDGRVLAQIGNEVQSFMSIDAYRATVHDPSSMWYEVKDDAMKAHFSRIFGPQIALA